MPPRAPNEWPELPLPCFACGKPLPTALTSVPVDFMSPPAGGLTFRASGNYGSALFDPVDGHSWLQINICDQCVEKGAVLRIETLRSKQNYKVNLFREER